MDETTKLIIKKWDELDPKEFNQMNKSHVREWKTSSMIPENHEKNILFLLKNDQDNILAQGQLVHINGVIFNEEIFNIFGIGGIIANVKGQGYGKAVMQAIKDYLIDKNKTGLGFTRFPNFYKKCGFLINNEVIKQFVHMVNNKKITNTEIDHVVCYLDSEDKFMEKVIRNPKKEVYLPVNPDW